MNSPRFFAHPNALVDSIEIGPGTRIWAFAHVMQSARIGANCNIGEQCFIEGGAVVGNDVVIKNGVALWEGVEIADKVFVGPNAVFTNDIVPRAKVFKHAVPTRVDEGASIGANATIRCGIQIGRWAVIGAGAVVTRDVPPFAMVVGNPARLLAYVCRCGERLTVDNDQAVQCACGSRFERQNGTVHELA
jgi:acetyltransferase-like isoleucine patch superfamily enzyme